MADLPPLHLGESAEGDPAEMQRLVREAVAAHGRRDPKHAARCLAAAETAAKKANLHRQAAKIRKALTILGQGQVPRLLVREGYLERE